MKVVKLRETQFKVTIVIIVWGLCFFAHNPIFAQQSKSKVDFAIFFSTPDPLSMNTLRNILGEEDNKSTIVEANTIYEAIHSNAEVVILSMGSRIHQEIDDTLLNDLKNRKIIGIGYGAAQLFGKLGLEINGGACAHNSHDYAPQINMTNNLLFDNVETLEPFIAFNLPPDTNVGHFAMYIPEKSHLRSIVDVIARWTGNENYAPIVQQGNYIMIGLAAPVSTWTYPYGKILRRISSALYQQPLELFSIAKWETTEPGRYPFKLAKGRSTEGLFSKTFFFQFAKPILFTASLKHNNSNNMMMLFMGEQREHWTRKNAQQGESLAINIEITKEDIEKIGRGYWQLKITNFDSNHTADCRLMLRY